MRTQEVCYEKDHWEGMRLGNWKSFTHVTCETFQILTAAASRYARVYLPIPTQQVADNVVILLVTPFPGHGTS